MFGKRIVKSSPDPASQFQSNLVQIILGEKEFKFAQIKRSGPFQREDNHKKCIIMVGSFKNLVRTTGPEKAQKLHESYPT
jgi:hypothetical protein